MCEKFSKSYKKIKEDKNNWFLKIKSFNERYDMILSEERKVLDGSLQEVNMDHNIGIRNDMNVHDESFTSSINSYFDWSEEKMFEDKMESIMNESHPQELKIYEKEIITFKRLKDLLNYLILKKEKIVGKVNFGKSYKRIRILKELANKAKPKYEPKPKPKP